jgi:basic membrane protein A and related proteins
VNSSHRRSIGLGAAALLTLAPISGALAAAPGTGGKAIGFIYVGPKDDFGYNQAAYQGSLAVKKAYPKLKVLEAENVPETAEATRVLERMYSQGARILFATSYGHLKYAAAVAKKHPDAVVVHQGGLEDPKGKLPNLGTYFGTVYEPVYLAGIAAGKASKTGKLGYVYAFPIPQTLANINAFTLGAQSVNPKIETIAVSTGSWCDPAKQAEAANSLISQGADVLTQHQDCTKTVIETAEKAGKFTIGYHADAASLAPKGWLTGSQWNWAPLYNDIVKVSLAGKFAKSKYDGDFRIGLRTGSNPFVQSKFGSIVSADTKGLITSAKAAIAKGGPPFKGPIMGQDGKEVIPAGKTPTYAEVEQMNYFVKGVIGKVG